MKPVSIIFLIISVFMIIIGVVLCCAGMVKANTSGVPLYNYTQSENGDAENEYYFEDDEVFRIKIDVDTANVRIICGADENKVIVKNITSNNIISAFDCIINNRTMSIENHNLFSLTSLAQGQFDFKGFRYGIKYITDKDKYVDKEKEITVYVKELCDLKNIDVTVNNGVIALDGYSNSTDYTLYAENGDISISNIKTDSTVKANVGTEGNIILQNVECAVSEITTKKGMISAEITAEEIKCINGGGDTEIKAKKSLEQYNYNLSAPLGRVILNGNDRGTEYKAIDGMLSSYIKVTSANGNVSVSQYLDQIKP